MIGAAQVHELLGRWWWSYDEGHFDVLATLLADDAHFTCRTDTGTTDFEDFVRADVRGRDAVVAWQTEHRGNSPYPLRHHGTNLHLTEQSGDEAAFAAYILVTHIVAGAITPLSSALVSGRVRRVGNAVRLSRLDVELDTRTSVPFADR